MSAVSLHSGLSAAVAVTALLVLTACNSTRQGQPGTTIDPSRPDLDEMVINATLSETNIRAAITNPTDGKRNAIVLARIAEIDILYNQYETDVLQEARTSGFLVSFTGIIAGLAGATASSAAASQNWSLLSGGITAADAAYDKEFLAEQTMNALVAQMRGERARVLGEIYDKLRSPIARYPMQAALSDLETYRQAGTMATALVAMNTASIQRAEFETEIAAEKVDNFTRGRVTSVERRPPAPAIEAPVLQEPLIDRVNALSTGMTNGTISKERIARLLNTVPVSDEEVRGQLGIIAQGIKTRTGQPTVRAEDITPAATGPISGILFGVTNTKTIDEVEAVLTP